MQKLKFLLYLLPLGAVAVPALSQMDPNNSGQWLSLLIRTFGVPGALFLVFIFTLHKGWIRLGREWEAPEVIKQTYEARIKTIEDLWNKDYDDAVAQYTLRLKEERDMTRQMVGEAEKRHRERCVDYENRLKMMREDRQRYLDVIIRSTELGERLVTAAELVVNESHRNESQRRPDV